MKIYVAVYYDSVLWVGVDEDAAREFMAEHECCVCIWEDGEEIGSL